MMDTIIDAQSDSIAVSIEFRVLPKVPAVCPAGPAEKRGPSCFYVAPVLLAVGHCACT